MPRRGVIYTVAPSPLDSNVIWAGTDDGLMHVTTNGGKNWQNITPPSVTEWSKVSLMEASHFDKQTAYAAINRIRLDDQKPHILRTKDGGKTWKEIVTGLPNDPINAVREDPTTRGLLFAGSERAVYVSFNDGDSWEALRLNMPATSIRDLVIKDDDIVVGTHGRSFWILDDITPLRQIGPSVKNANSSDLKPISPISKDFTPATTLFSPQTAVRVRWNMWTDTPLPQEEPAGQNPPDGASINYYLAKTAKDVALEIYDNRNKLVRRFTNADKLYEIPEGNVPFYWIRPQAILSGEAGGHRFMWDLHYAPLDVPPSYPIGATFLNTAPDPTAPWVMPSDYTIKLIVDGQTFQKPLTVKLDPRVKTPWESLKLQHDISVNCYKNRQQIAVMQQKVVSLKENLAVVIPNANQDKTVVLKDLEKQLQALESGNAGSNLKSMDAAFATLFNTIHDTDMPPTNQATKASRELSDKFDGLQTQWLALEKKLLAALDGR
jgi:hypothetical protein